MSYFLKQFRPRLLCGICILPLVRCSGILTAVGYGTRAFSSRGAILYQSPKVANPRSSNPESQAINTSRGKESRHDDTPDTRSVQSPISNQFGPTSEKHEGEEQSTTTEQVHNDPSKSPEEKRKNDEQAGRRPMGPEDEK
ncbi:unnamed protein product [Aspergillus oryzae]|nr:unnamed protein product [Aspergillus oryzae]